MKILVVNVTCFGTTIITVIISAWFAAFSVYDTAWFVCDVPDRFGFCDCRFACGESREYYCDSSYIAYAFLLTMKQH
jgi:hypothetical protein